jgi:hypothetical protein
VQCPREILSSSPQPDILHLEQVSFGSLLGLCQKYLADSNLLHMEEPSEYTAGYVRILVRIGNKNISRCCMMSRSKERALSGYLQSAMCTSVV